jgi:type II secretory pathway component PulC
MFNNITIVLLAGPWKQRMGWIALCVISLLFLFTLIRTPLNWYSDVRLVKAQPMVPEMPTYKDNYLELIQQIPNWHIFGHLEKDTTILPITSLHIRLIGIVSAIPKKQSSVLISEASQPGKVYVVGDTLPVGVKVNAIMEDGVILENAGRLEKLPLQRQPLSFQGRPKSILHEG